MEQSSSNYVTDRIAELESSLINARAKFKAEIRTIRGYYLIVAIGVIFLILHYSLLLVLPTWLLITNWIVSVLLLMAVFGTDTEKTKSEVEKVEAIKRIYLGFPEPSDSKPEYFDSLVKINVENL